MTWFNIIKEEVALYMGIDCEPGIIRPDDVLRVLLTGINIPGINIEDEPESKFFGAWKWKWLVDRDTYKRHESDIKERIEELHNVGMLRGAEWGLVGDEESGV